MRPSFPVALRKEWNRAASRLQERIATKRWRVTIGGMSSERPDLSIAAALLAGGASRRMGRDKAGLEVEGVLLWKRQVGVLQSVRPRELFISGAPQGPYAGCGIPLVCDAVPRLGPLAGLAAGLREIEGRLPFLLVLAVDLPAMEGGYLRALAEKAVGEGIGLIPECDGELEPLAAIYPVAFLAFAEAGLASGRRSVRSAVREAIRGGILRAEPVAPFARALFKNINLPADYAALVGNSCE